MAFGLVVTVVVSAFSWSPGKAEAAFVGGTIIVKVREGVDLTKLEDYGTELEPVFERVYRLKTTDPSAVLNVLRRRDWVEYAEDDGRLKIALSAQDPLFVLDQQELFKQWYLPKIQTHLAWEKTTGNNIIVAVVDTGIDGKHQDLADGRVVGGFLSYCQVKSMVTNDCLVRITGEVASGINSDDNGHGTIVAGIIGAIANNNKGIAGINWNVRLMPIKALDSSGEGLASDVAAGIRWAADHGARIINLSIGGPGLSGGEILQDAIAYAYSKGVLIISAAGNDSAVTGTDLDANPGLPVCADGGQNMVLGVAAVDRDDRKATFSNYGARCVDIAAPGTGTFTDKTQKQGMVSTYFDPTKPGEQDLYVYALGTSVAAPIVSGVAALTMSAFPDLDARAVRDRLIASADNIDRYNQSGCNGGGCVGKIGRGRINALKAVTESSLFQNETLIKTPQGRVFLIERGLKRPVSEFVLRQRFAGLAIPTVSAEQADSVSTGESVPPSDGSLIRKAELLTVYLVEGGQRRGLSYLAFISRGFKFDDIVTLPAAELDSYPLGIDAPVLDGLLVKSADHPAVFVVEKGVKRLLSYFVFQLRGFDKQSIAVLSAGELAQYPFADAFLYPPPEGTLVRGSEIATVYLFEQGRRRGLNLAAFQNRGFNFTNVKVIPQAELQYYEAGTDIIE